MTALHVAQLASGLPDRPPIVLLHGFTGDITTWLPLMEHLPWKQPVWAVDLVGHGRSPAPDDADAYSMDNQVAAVLAALSEAGVTRAHWLGYSMGGRVALALALSAPERVASLTLIGASPGIAEADARAERVAADEALATRIETEGLAAFVEYWAAQALFATQARLGEAHLAAMNTQRLRNRPEALAATLRAFGTGSMPSLWSRLGELARPVLLIAGAEDLKFTRLAQQMAESLPDGRVEIVPGAGHAVQLEDPAMVARSWADFAGAAM
jgi:2-succinyl-6-hydroxy-2,4-cyclohexadiene-1-carboxylate synthase